MPDNYEPVMCKACNEEISRKKYHITDSAGDRQQYHKECYSHECGGCGKKIKEGQVSKALGKRWHKACFKCGGCSKAIDGSFLTKNSEPYCKPCYNNEYGLPCEVCKEFITGHILKYNQKAYHYSCVSCKTCNQPFSDGAALSVKGGKFIHNDCKQVHKKSGMTRGDVEKVREKKKELDAEEDYSGDLPLFEHECMKQHNVKRSQHSAAPLEWSEECAQHAREWVQHLVQIDSLAHDHDSGMGENCGYFNSSSASTKADNVWAVNVCDMWYNEIKKYNFKKNDYQPQTGHFTQMIWKDTEKMGCAIAKSGTKVYIVANYYPPGNFMGRYKDNVLP